MGETLERTYRATGTGKAFHGDNSMVRGVMGPTGSGKSSMMAMECFFRACRQSPDRQGWRRTRWLVMRRTYRELMSSTLKTWQYWYRGMGRLRQTAPIEWKMESKDLKIWTGERVKISMEAWFLSLENTEEAIDRLRSMDITGAWINEAGEIESRSVFDWILNRCGRYPSPDDGGVAWSGLFMDTNSVPMWHWWYDLAEVQKPTGYRFWTQPPAVLRDSSGAWVFNPGCENVEGQSLGADYWMRQIPGKSEQWIRNNFCCEYMPSLSGKPVYPEYQDRIHYAAKELEPFRGVPLVLGFDFGLTPACAIVQQTPKGQVRCLDELPASGMGIRQFTRDVLKPFLNTRYLALPVIGWGDPAGAARSQTDERTCMQELREQGIQVLPASSNLFLARREAVAGFLLRPIESDMWSPQPDHGRAFLLSPTCRQLRSGFLGEYRYKRLAVEGHEIYRDEPEKGEVSHVHDGLQYGCLGLERPSAAGPGGARGFGGPGVARRVVAPKVAW